MSTSDPQGAEWVAKVNHDALLLAAADALAAWLHRDDVDKQKKPLIGHCRRVAATLREQGFPAHVQAAGLLHDVLEDQPPSTANDRMQALYLLGERVALFVLHLTRKTSYDEYIRVLSTCGLNIRAIKLADLRDNLDESRGPIKESLRKRYVLAVERLTDAEGREP